MVLVYLPVSAMLKYKGYPMWPVGAVLVGLYYLLFMAESESK
jgi:hypothetical protein